MSSIHSVITKIPIFVHSLVTGVKQTSIILNCLMDPITDLVKILQVLQILVIQYPCTCGCIPGTYQF